MRTSLMTMLATLLLSACAQAQPPVALARPAIADMEPDVTRQVQALLAQAAQATLAPETLTDNARAAMLGPRMQDMRATLQSCGAITALELLERGTKGEDRLYVYRAPCAGKPLIVEIDFGKGARIHRLVVRPQ